MDRLIKLILTPLKFPKLEINKRASGSSNDDDPSSRRRHFVQMRRNVVKPDQEVEPDEEEDPALVPTQSIPPLALPLVVRKESMAITKIGIGMTALLIVLIKLVRRPNHAPVGNNAMVSAPNAMVAAPRASSKVINKITIPLGLVVAAISIFTSLGKDPGLTVFKTVIKDGYGLGVVMTGLIRPLLMLACPRRFFRQNDTIGVGSIKGKIVARDIGGVTVVNGQGHPVYVPSLDFYTKEITNFSRSVYYPVHLKVMFKRGDGRVAIDMVPRFQQILLENPDRDTSEGVEPPSTQLLLHVMDLKCVLRSNVVRETALTSLNEKIYELATEFGIQLEDIKLITE